MGHLCLAIKDDFYNHSVCRLRMIYDKVLSRCMLEDHKQLRLCINQHPSEPSPRDGFRRAILGRQSVKRKRHFASKSRLKHPAYRDCILNS